MECVALSEPTEDLSTIAIPIHIQLKSVIAKRANEKPRAANFSYIFMGILDGRIVQFTVPVSMNLNAPAGITRQEQKKLDHDARWMEGTVVKSVLDSISGQAGRITLQKSTAESTAEGVISVALNPFEALRNFLNLTKKQIGEFTFLADELKINLGDGQDQSLQNMLNAKWTEAVQDPGPASPDDLHALCFEQKQREEQERAAKTGPRQKQN